MVLLKKGFLNSSSLRVSLWHPERKVLGTYVLPLPGWWILAMQWTLCWSRSLEASTTATGVEARFGQQKNGGFLMGFHDGKGSGDFVCHSSVTRKHPKAKSVRNHRQACSVCGHLGHEACGKSKPQKDKLFESSFVIPGVFFRSLCPKLFWVLFCQFSNF